MDYHRGSLYKASSLEAEERARSFQARFGSELGGNIGLLDDEGIKRLGNRILAAGFGALDYAIWGFDSGQPSLDINLYVYLEDPEIEDGENPAISIRSTNVRVMVKAVNLPELDSRVQQLEKQFGDKVRGAYEAGDVAQGASVLREIQEAGFTKEEFVTWVAMKLPGAMY